MGSALIDIESNEKEDSSYKVEKSSVVPSEINSSSSIAVTDVHERNGGKILTTPAVRKIGKENNIDLTSVKATGPKGRILKEDILNHINISKNSVEIPAKNAAAMDSVCSSIDVKVPIRGIQRLMVKSMKAAADVSFQYCCV